MKVTGIIAEYNPFHKGHQWQIDTLRRQGSTHVVAVMGGNFLQRGAPALAPKHLRTQMALRSGADLVLELPLPYACAPAQRFAFGGVALLTAIGCVDELAFGSECGDLPLLRQATAAVDDPAVRAVQSRLLGDGHTFARARQLAVEEVCSPALARVLAAPNNTLGVEYLRQIQLLGAAMTPITLPRTGAEHGSDQPRDGVASASLIRRMLREGNYTQAGEYLPVSSLELLGQAVAEGWAPADARRLDTAVLAHLRRLTRCELGELPDLSEGLEYRLYDSIRESCTLQELLERCKTKRYPLARLRRLTLSAFLGIPAELSFAAPPYLRVLGFGARGAELLTRMKHTAALPVSHSLARLEKMGDDCARFAALESRSTDLYALALPRARPCGLDYTIPVVTAHD